MPPPPLPRRGCPEEEEEAEADAKTETETETLAELEAELREDAAVTVQAHWRGHRGRGEALNMLDSEIAALERTGRSPEGTVQQQDRDSHRESESETEKELEALEAELREDAAVTLQANWRGSMARRSCEQQIMQYLADADAIFWEHVKDEVSPRPEERADPSPTEPPSQPPAAQTRRQRKPLATPNRSTKAHVAHVEPAKPPPVSPLPLNEEDAALRIQCRVRGNAEEQQQKAAEEKAAAEAAATKRAAEEQKAVEEQEQKAAEEKAVVEAAAAKRAAEEQEQDQKAAEEKAPTIQKCTEADEAAAAAGLKLDPEPELEPEPELKPQMDQLQKQEQATAAIDLNAGGGDEAGVFHVHYTSANGQCEQPVTMRELALKLAHSDVDWQTLVWSPGMAHWAPLEECLGHEAWADQLEDYLQLAIEQASQDDDTELVVGAVEPQPVGTTTVAAEPEMQQPQDEQQAEGTHNATKESTTAVTLELLWT